MTKQKKLRHCEYYDLQPVFDRLYADSQNGKIFTGLMKIISSEENIRLAYRNIKRNSGSNTAVIDKLPIKEIEKLSVDGGMAHTVLKTQRVSGHFLFSHCSP